ncbi:MAG: bifunctional demethylmenaquinone methyltransferase/2-methoxy-6-polyprenyl-1,4-benzoquinol methylase UbiE [Nitrospirota bacterium]
MEEKSTQIKRMFSSIAGRYDFLNHLSSMGMDLIWRARCAREFSSLKGGFILDVATGTADLAIEMARETSSAVKIIGVDFSEEMITLAKNKITKKKLHDRISFLICMAESLPFRDNVFDGCTIAFGIRNLPDRKAGLKEMYRVLKEDGHLLVLEFSRPAKKFFSTLYRFYSKYMLPFYGGIFSKRYAYEYLPASVENFPSREKFKEMMKECGFSQVQHCDMTFGIVTLYKGTKKKEGV